MRNIPSPIRVFFFIVVPLFAVLFFVSDQLSKNLNFTSEFEEYNYYKATNQDKLATEKVLSVIVNQPDDIDKHIVFLNQYLDLNDKNKNLIRNKFERVFSTSLLDYFKDLSKSQNEKQRSLGYYGLARILISQISFSEKKVLIYINNINEEFPGLNELRGDYFLNIDSYDVAEVQYEKALSNRSESVLLKEKLAELYIYHDQYEKAFNLIGLDQNVNSSLRYYVAKKNGLSSVIQFAYMNDWNQLFNWSTLSSLLILLFWISFIFLLKKITRKHILAALLVAIVIFLFAPTVYILNEGFNELFGGISNPFLYHFFCVAIPEELMKVSAVVITYYLFKAKKLDTGYIELITLGIFSSAIFAFFENNLYFNLYADSTIVFGRFVNASFIHVLCTSTFIIGVFYGRFFKEQNHFYRIILILTPFVMHAFYNTCVETMAPLAKVVVIVFFILWIFLLNRILKVNKAKILNTDFNIKMSNLVLLSLPSVIIVQYTFSFYEFGALAGKKVMYSSIMNYGFTLLIAAVAVLKLNDYKFFRTEVFSKMDKSKVSSLRLKPFDPVSRNFFGEEIKVIIEQKLKDNQERTWYLVHGQDKKYLLRIKDKYIDLDEYKIKMICLEINKDILKQGFIMKDFTYLGILLSSPIYDNQSDKS